MPISLAKSSSIAGITLWRSFLAVISNLGRFAGEFGRAW